MGQEIRKLNIGVQYDENKQVIGICKNLLVNQETYNALLNQYNEHLQQKLIDETNLYRRIKELERAVDDLQQEIKKLKGEE